MATPNKDDKEVVISEIGDEGSNPADKDERDTLVSVEEQRASYGTIDPGKENKRFWLRTPEGKLVYAHNASEPDSMMERKSSSGGALNILGGGGASNPLENYFRAIDYIEQNIDFPPDSEDDPIDLYSKHKYIFLGLNTLMMLINGGWFVLGYCKKDHVIENITKSNDLSSKPHFFSTFVDVSLGFDGFIFLLVFITGMMAFWVPKSRFYSCHSIVAVISILSVLFLCYIHQIYLLAFLLRILYYVYVRYIISILHTILLLPTNYANNRN